MGIGQPIIALGALRLRENYHQEDGFNIALHQMFCCFQVSTEGWSPSILKH